MHQPYAAPLYKESSFNCPHCNAFAEQEWFPRVFAGNPRTNKPLPFVVSLCHHCEDFLVWEDEAIVLPNVCIAPLPNADLSDEIRTDFEEARKIVELSPRGAAALLRLCIQKLCKELGEPGKKINDDIKSLVSKGLPVRVQQALDSVRVVGNEGVHPGTLDLRDDRETALTLFKLVNFVCEKMISQPREVAEFFEALPEEKRKHIEERDKVKDLAPHKETP